MNSGILKDPAKRAEFVFGQPMKPCPKCGSYRMGYQTPIKLDIKPDDSARQIVEKWALEVKATSGILEGPVFLVCQDCRHKGPSLDCSGRTSADVGRDPKVSAEVKRLWNSQEQKTPVSRG